MATWDELGIEIRGSRGIQKVKCPNCAHTRKNKTDKSLSVNLNKGAYNCFNCGFAGYVDGKTEEETKAERKKYARPQVVELPLSETTINWFVDKRGIERETLQYFRVTESKDWMPSRGDTPAGTRTCINFNYYRGDEKVNIKYRDALKCFRMTKDAELVLYNLNALKDRTDMLICEGEIDAMTFYQSGHYGAVSVPNGASKGNARLEYLDNCSNALTRMEKIIIAVDGDEAGTYLRNELTNRFGAHRCWFVTYPEGCKDANEVLLKHGPAAVTKLWKTATPPPLEDILTLDDVETNLDDIFENGWPKIEPIGYKNFDQLLNFAPGEITTVTGIPAHGKDEFILQVLIRKASRYGEKSGIFNFEESAELIYIKAVQKYSAKPFYRANRKEMMNQAQKASAYKFVRDHIYVLDIATADLSIDGVLRKGAELVLRKGIKYYVIGPYNCLEDKRLPGQSEGEYVSMLYQKMARFAIRHQVHVFFVAHTTKMPKDEHGQYVVPSLYSIAGSANFFNKTHNGLTVYRNYGFDTSDIHVQKVKIFYNGTLGVQRFHFDVATGRYAEEGTPHESEIDYQQKQQTQAEFEFQNPEEPPTPDSKPEMTDVDHEEQPPRPFTYASAFDVDLNQWNGPIPESEVSF